MIRSSIFFYEYFTDLFFALYLLTVFYIVIFQVIFRCVLRKAFNLSNNEAICVTQPQRLSCNSLHTLPANSMMKSHLAAVYSSDSCQKSMDSENRAEALLINKVYFLFLLKSEVFIF